MTIVFGLDLDLGADALFQGGNVRNHANQFAFLLQAGQGIQSHIQRILVQSAKAFVQKQRINARGFARHARQTQCQSQRHDEAFAAREVFGRTHRATLVLVYHIQLQRRIVGLLEQIAVAHVLQLAVGLLHQLVKRQALRKQAVFFAIAAADQFMQRAPTAAFLLLRQDEFLLLGQFGQGLLLLLPLLF